MSSHSIANLINTEQTLERLENDFWGRPPEGASTLVVRCHNIRQKRIKDFEVEDFRVLISQQMGLPSLVPIAIRLLNNDAFLEGDYYKGDLLNSVLKINPEFWKKNPKLKEDIIEVFKKNHDRFNHEVDTDTKDELFEAHKKLISG